MEKITKIGEYRQNEDQGLTEAAQTYADNATSPNTKKAYKTDLRLFAEWAEDQGLCHLPATGATVANYISHLSDMGRKPSTIARALSSISQAHKSEGLETPTKSNAVATVHRGINRERGTAQRRAKPIVITELRRLCDKIKPSFLGRRDKALILIGWSAALRRSELVALNVENIDFVEEGMIVLIVNSKTDQVGQGYKIGIPYAKDEKYCPVKSLKRWRDLADIKSGPLFFAIGTPGKKFHAEVAKRKKLSAATVNAIIKRRIKQGGMNPAGYSGHSLRAGFITAAAKEKIPEYLIQAHTRHRSAKVLRGYIRDGDLFESNSLAFLL